MNCMSESYTSSISNSDEEKPSYRLGIVGSRTFTSYSKFKKLVGSYIEANGIPSCIVSGGAKGADSLAERYAKENKIRMQIFLPEWNKYGKKAGLMRNTDIVNNSDVIIAIPTDSSVGTYDTIRKANKKGVSVHVAMNGNM